MSTFTITTPTNISSLVKLGSVGGLTWTRSLTTATITQIGHGMFTGDNITVTVSSDIAAITLGVKVVTVINSNTYTFTCINAGSTSGTITVEHIDDYVINGGHLIIDQHSRFGLNQNKSSIIGDIVLSPTLGGTVEFNSTLVRLIPYNNGNGNVPSPDTIISIDDASGKLICVYSTLNAEPIPSGLTMPTSGFILIRQWNEVPFKIGSLTGINASATGTDVEGFLEIVGADLSTTTVNRLNSFIVRGDWYKFQGAITDGVRSTTYQIPSNGSLVYAPGVWVETDTNSNEYEFYPCAGSITAIASNIATDAVRGKVCWISNTGLVRFGSDGINSTGGFIPPSGRRIRIPNIFFRNCNRESLTQNVLPNVTLATRHEFNTTGGGVIDIDKASMNWYLNLNQPFSVRITNTGILTNLTLTECASPISWSDVGVGQEDANSQFALLMSLNFAGGSMTNCTWSRHNLTSTGNYVVTLSDIIGFNIINNRVFSLQKSTNSTTGSYTITRTVDCDWVNTIIGGGRIFMTTCSNISFNNTTYYDHPSLTTLIGTGMFAFDLASRCLGIKIDGIDFGGLTLCQPYNGILQIGSAGCGDIILRNIGTYNSPLNMGGNQVDNIGWTRVTTTATITNNEHGLKVNDPIYVLISSNSSTISVGLKTITSVPTPNTFTFAATNSGPTSGSLTYYPIMSGTLVQLTNNAAANNIKIQRCYTRGLRTNLITSDNSSKNITLENVYGDYINTPLLSSLNTNFNGIGCTLSLTAQNSIYGSHWANYYIHDIVPNTTSVSWSRTTTTAIITSNNHKLRTGMLINVITTSDSNAINLGEKSITVLDTNTFSFTCLNNGATSGTLTFVAYSGRISILCNESTSETVDQYTIDNGTPMFTSTGGLFMPIINQQITFITPKFILGHNKFPITLPTMFGSTIQNYNLFYQIDKGFGYSVTKNLYYNVVGGGGINGSTNVTMSSTIGVEVGDHIFGTNIAPNAKVVSIINETNIVVDIPNIGNVSGVLVFNQLPNETDITNIGFKLKVTVRTRIANNAPFTTINIITDSDNTSRALQYPLDIISLTLNGIISGSDVVILQAGTDIVLDQIDQLIGTSWNYNYEIPITVDIFVSKAGYVPFYIRNYNLSTSNSNLPIVQIVDRNYIS